jgi:hypothetical protein
MLEEYSSWRSSASETTVVSRTVPAGSVAICSKLHAPVLHCLKSVSPLGSSKRRTELREFEEWMRHKGFGDLNFVPHDFLLFVRIFFSTAITDYVNFFRQHGEWREGVGFPEQNAMLVACIAFVMDAMVLADDNPVVVDRVFHRGSSKVPQILRRIFL